MNACLLKMATLGSPSGSQPLLGCQPALGVAKTLFQPKCVEHSKADQKLQQRKTIFFNLVASDGLYCSHTWSTY